MKREREGGGRERERGGTDRKWLKEQVQRDKGLLLPVVGVLFYWKNNALATCLNLEVIKVSCNFNKLTLKKCLGTIFSDC